MTVTTTLTTEQVQQLVDAAIGEHILAAAEIALPQLEDPDDIAIRVRTGADGAFVEPSQVQHAFTAYNGGLGRDMEIVLRYHGAANRARDNQMVVGPDGELIPLRRKDPTPPPPIVKPAICRTVDDPLALIVTGLANTELARQEAIAGRKPRLVDRLNPQAQLDWFARHRWVLVLAVLAVLAVVATVIL